MKFDDKFYNFVSSSEEEYGPEATGRLNVQRLIEQKDPWKKAEWKRQPKKKVIVLHAPNFLSTTKLEQILLASDSLKEMEEEGFSVYVYGFGRFHPLTFKGTSYPDITELFEENDKHVTDNQVRKQIIEHFESLTADDVFVLNDKELPLLIDQSPDSWSDIGNEARFKSAHFNTKTLGELLRKKGSDLRLLELDSCMNLGNELLPDDLSLPKLEEIVLKSSYQKYKIKEKSIRRHLLLQVESFNRLLRAAPALKKLYFPNLNFTSWNLPYPEALIELELYNLVGDSSSFADFMSKLTQLKKLKLFKINGIDYRNFPKTLEHLTLSSFTPNDELLAELQKLESLKYLAFEGLCEYESTTQNYDFCLSPQLEELYLSRCKLPAALLANCLSKTQKLKKLLISGKYPLDIQTALDLPELEELDVSAGVSLSKDSLNRLLSSSHKLKYLNLSSCPTINSINFDDLDLSCLEELTVSGTDISSATLEKILSKTPKLKILWLVDCQALNDPFKSSFQLVHLEKLNASRSNLSMENLEKLIDGCTMLKTVQLDTCALKENLSKALELPSLVELDLRHTKLTTANFYKLVSRATQLSDLYLSRCGENALSDELPGPLPPITLSYLNCEYTNRLHPSIYNALLKAGSKLKSYSFFQYNLSEDLADDANLSAMETLSVDQCRMSSKSLSKILHNANKLKSITLKAIDGLDNPLSGEFDFPDLEEITFDNSQNEKSSSVAYTLLTHAGSKLKKIRLKYALDALSTSAVDSISLQNLKELCLNHLECNPTLLANILNRAPNLENLELGDLGIWGRELQSRSYRLTNLHKLSLSDMTCSADLLENMLSNAKKLQNLIIASLVIQSETQLTGNPLELSSLSQLSVNESNLSTGSLLQILVNARKLQTLLLENCGNLAEPMERVPDLQDLRTLSLKQSNLSADLLQNLLAAAPNLTSLELCNIKNLANIDTEHLAFNALKDLTIEVTEHIDARKIYQLLEKAPKLEKLEMKLPAGDKNTVLAIIEILKLNLKRVFINGQKYINNNGKLVRVDELRSALDLLDSPKKSDMPIQSMTIKESQGLDADTTPDPNKELSGRKFFYGINQSADPEVSATRLDVFNRISSNPNPCGINEAFRLSNEGEQELTEPKVVPQALEYDTKNSCSRLPGSSHDYYYAKVELELHSSWQALPSLSAEEAMLSYHLSPAAEVEIKYSKRDSRYLIRSKSGSRQAVTMDYTLKVPKPAPTTELPEAIQAKIKELLAYKAQALAPMTKENPNGADYLEAITQNQVGACRHRAAVLQFWLQKEYKDLPVRYIANEFHAFVEITYNNRCITCDLGGYPSKIRVREAGKKRAEIQELTETGKITLPGFNLPNIVTKLVSWFSQTKAAESVTEAPTQAFLKPQVKSKASSVNGYMLELFASGEKKRLIRLADSESLKALRYSMQAFCHKTSRPCFYAHSPQDLICQDSFLTREGNEGRKHKGPGGPLYDFIQANRDKKPLIIVNYDNFKPADVVRFNSLLDETRKADGVELPPEAVVVGLIDPSKPTAYDGSDFYSRFDTRPSDYALPKEEGYQQPSIPEHQGSEEDYYVIDLFGGQRWEEQMQGVWELRGKNLSFVEGELTNALRANKPLLLKNAPWENPDFLRFWQDSLFYKKTQSRYDEQALPEGFGVYKASGYDWDLLIKPLHVIPVSYPLDSDCLILNPSFYQTFFGQYRFDSQTQGLIKDTGLLESYANKQLKIYLSESISADQWAMFLHSCLALNISIELSCKPGLSLPSQMKTTVPEGNPKVGKVKHGDCFIRSSDPDLTLLSLKADTALDISEVRSTQLMGNIDAKYDAKQMEFLFSEEEGFLINALNEGQRVVLTGRFSPEMVDHLNALCLKRQQSAHAKGTLVIVSKEEPFVSMIPVQEDKPVVADKKKALGANAEVFTERELESHTFCELQAMAKYHTLYPAKEKNKAWEGMLDLPPLMPKTGFDLDNAAGIDKAFHDKRLKEVLDGLSVNPFVFLAGVTGAGKTTFVLETLSQEGALYVGEEHIADWASDKSAKTKYLFIDEANISSKHWSVFEGLLKTPPAILIRNQWYPLSDKHKVVFAGNPLSYGGERQLPSLFERHGLSVLFDLLPLESLYVKHLVPLFTAAGLDPKEASTPILQAAQAINNASTDSILISPREMTQMALLTISYCRENPAASAAEVARYYAYTLGKNLLKSEQQAKITSLWPEKPVLNRSNLPVPEQFTLNASNRPAYEALCDVLALRRLRQSNPLYKSPGLGGLLLEGEPGIGKSKLVVKGLMANGVSDFLMIPASTPLSERELLLLDAFDKGKVVVIDEVNSGPVMEQLLNALLMGKTPNGKKPTTPGFTLIFTQNPSTMSGRIRMSEALQRRMMRVVVPTYNQEEMIGILNDKGMPPLLSKLIVEEVESGKKRMAGGDNTCFRDLSDSADAIVVRIKPLLDFVNAMSAYHKLREGEGKTHHFIPWFQFTKDDKLRSVNKLLLALSSGHYQLSEKDLAVLKNGRLNRTITDYLAENADSIQQQFGCKEPIKSVEQLLFVADNSPTMEKIIRKLEQYRNERQRQPNKYHPFFIPQFDKDSKIQAVQTLIDLLEGKDVELNQQDRKALAQGSLGKLVGECIGHYNLVEDNEIRSIDDLVGSCKPSTTKKDL